jgi:hypothetical protein
MGCSAARREGGKFAADFCRQLFLWIVIPSGARDLYFLGMTTSKMTRFKLTTH